jgi:hypothetical protein
LELELTSISWSAELLCERSSVREIQCARDPVCERSSVREIQCARDPVGDTTLVVRLRAARRGVKNALLQRPVQVCESYPFFSDPGCCSLGSFGVELRILKSGCLSNI